MTAEANTGLIVFVFWGSDSWMVLRAMGVSKGNKNKTKTNIVINLSFGH